jgi:hypothetical protein
MVAVAERTGDDLCLEDEIWEWLPAACSNGDGVCGYDKSQLLCHAVGGEGVFRRADPILWDAERQAKDLSGGLGYPRAGCLHDCESQESDNALISKNHHEINHGISNWPVEMETGQLYFVTKNFRQGRKHKNIIILCACMCFQCKIVFYYRVGSRSWDMQSA